MHDQPIPPGYCQCGCGGKTPLYKITNATCGYVEGAPRPWIPGHHARKGYSIDLKTGCWLWQGRLNSNGYGRVQIGDRDMPAHRWAYEDRHGPVLEGLTLDHLCGNRRCVNPDHLEAVDHATNCRRGRQSKLTWDDVDQIRALEGTLTQRAIANRFGVTQACIQRVLARETWVR